MPAMPTADDMIAAADVAERALRPAAGLDWSVKAGPLDWDVAQTITHMIAAAAKYTLYLASRSERFIALTLTRWPGATNAEVLDSIAPVAAGLAAIALGTPPDVRAFHLDGPTDAAGYLGRACVEFLVHTDDALAGLGLPFRPPARLCGRVLGRQYPARLRAGQPPAEHWPSLLRATGRPVR